MSQVLTVKEISDKLRVTEQCVYDWIKEGKLKGIKAGGVIRVEEEEYLRFIGKDGNNEAR